MLLSYIALSPNKLGTISHQVLYKLSIFNVDRLSKSLLLSTTNHPCCSQILRMDLRQWMMGYRSGRDGLEVLVLSTDQRQTEWLREVTNQIILLRVSPVERSLYEDLCLRMTSHDPPRGCNLSPLDPILLSLFPQTAFPSLQLQWRQVRILGVGL